MLCVAAQQLQRSTVSNRMTQALAAHSYRMPSSPHSCFEVSGTHEVNPEHRLRGPPSKRFQLRWAMRWLRRAARQENILALFVAISEPCLLLEWRKRSQNPQPRLVFISQSWVLLGSAHLETVEPCVWVQRHRHSLLAWQKC